MWIHVLVMMMIGVLCGVVQAAQQQVTVTLSNGDVLHGELVSDSDTHLVIEHPVLGQLKLAREGSVATYSQAVMDANVYSKEESAPKPVGWFDFSCGNGQRQQQEFV